jgi:hypothetical protein
VVTDQATRVVTAGWYQDPATSQQVRWWNGVAWTEHTREKPSAAQGAIGSGAGAAPQTTQTAQATETTEQRIAAARELERQFGISGNDQQNVAVGTQTAGPAQHAPATGSISQVEHLGAFGQPASVHKTAARASTGSAWMIALSPVLALVLGIAAAYVYLYLAAPPFVFAIAAAVVYLLCLLWAIADSRTLKARGFTPPSPALALLTGLGYLIARRMRVPGTGPLAMLVVVGLVTFGAPPLASLMGQTEALTTALNIQRTISADYLSHGKAVQVNCPPLVDASKVGTLYTCDATMATGVHRTVWVSIDSDDGKFSYSFGL